MQMHKTKYKAVMDDSGSSARMREQLALSRGVDLLCGLDREQTTSPQRQEALLYIRRLWTYFIEDLSRPDNGLPDRLRADLISIGIWIIKEADLIRRAESGNLQALIAVNVAMRDALK
jgi:flagellar protein FlaF